MKFDNKHYRMRVTFYLLFIVLMIGCKEEEQGFTSLLGKWIYTTPDEKIEITFDITAGTSEILSVGNQTIKVEGVEGKAEIQTEVITETTIGMIRINANDKDLVYPYNIVFKNLSASTDFSAIEVEEAIYTFPWTDNITLNDIQIVRR